MHPLPSTLMVLILSTSLAQAAKPADPFKLMHSEALGTLRIDQGGADALKAFTQKPRMGKIEEWGADGCFHQTVAAPAEGLEISLVSDTRNGTQRVASITLKAPCTFKTRKGIGIGSTYAEAAKAYGPHIQREDSQPGKVLVAGSVYGGLAFLFKGGKVTQILLGASAE